MKIRLISDLHIDVNDTYGVSIPDNDVFTLIAGDICGTVDNTIEWVKNNVKRGAFCAGNHIVYNPKVREYKETMHYDKIEPIETLKQRLHEAFPLDSDITFFDDDVGVLAKEICDGVLLVADVAYTDYKLRIKGVNPTGDYKRNMWMSEPKFGRGSYLNDFVYGFTKRKMYDKEPWDGPDLRYGTPRGLWQLRPKYYRNHHNRVWRKITQIVESNPNKNIILMTHHCISKKCISAEYVDDALNASYVSNKDAWIRKHPNIKLILSGHVHHRAHFKVGETLYVLNPLGYCRDTMKQFNPETNKMEMWTPHCFVDTDTWELAYEPYENEDWEEKKKAADEYILKYAGMFF